MATTILFTPGEPLRTWEVGRRALCRVHPPLGMAQEQKASERENSHHPNLIDLLLKAGQSTLIAPPLVILSPLKGDGAEPLRNWGRTTEVMRLPSELQGEVRVPRKRQQGSKCLGSGDGPPKQAGSVRDLRKKKVIPKCCRELSLTCTVKCSKKVPNGMYRIGTFRVFLKSFIEENTYTDKNYQHLSALTIHEVLF